MLLRYSLPPPPSPPPTTLGISIGPRQDLLEDNSAFSTFNQRTVKKGYCECGYNRQWNPKRHTDGILPLFSYHVFFNLSDVRFKHSHAEEALSKEDLFLKITSSRFMSWSLKSGSTVLLISYLQTYPYV